MRALLAVFAFGLAVAQANPDADALLQRGYTFYERGDFPAAVAVFQQAYALSPEPRFLLNIALSQEKIDGQCGAALATLDRFFAVCADCSLRQAAGEDQKRVRAGCMARLRVTTEPRGAQVRIADSPARPAPVDLSLPAGDHALRVTLDGHAPVRRDVHLEWAQRMELVVSLSPAPDRSGRLQLANVPEQVEVRLGDTPLGATPIAVPPGPATLQVTTRDGERSLPVLVRPGGVTAVDLGAVLARPPVDYRTEATWSAAAGGVGLVAGVVFSVLLAGDLADERGATNRAAAEAAKDAAIRDAIAAQIGYGVAAAGLGTAVTLWLLSDDP